MFVVIVSYAAAGPGSVCLAISLRGRRILLSLGFLKSRSYFWYISTKLILLKVRGVSLFVAVGGPFMSVLRSMWLVLSSAALDAYLLYVFQF